MSSLRISAAGAAEIAAAAAAERRASHEQHREPGVTEARWSGSEGTVSGISNVRCSGAPTATATGRCALFRSAPAAGFVGFAFDPDNGKDQYGSHAIAWSAIHG